jgi:hypothetical protein
VRIQLQATHRLGHSTAIVMSVALLVGLAGPPTRGSAADPGPASDFALTVSPTRLVIAPGQINDEQHFKVSNKGSAPIEVEISKRDFTANAQGTMLFQAHAAYSASNWVTATPDQFQLGPGATQDVGVRIALPSQPEPGDHQVALVFVVPAGAEKTTNIRVNRGVGTPVFIAVPGPIDTSTHIAGLRVPGFALRGPLTFSTTVQDTGTVHRDFRGDGNRLAVSVDGQKVEFPDFTVLRGATREIDARWADAPLWCICEATMSLARADGSVQTVTARVVILPLHLLGIAVAVILLLLFGGRFVRRRYRAHIVAAAGAYRSRHVDPED